MSVYRLMVNLNNEEADALLRASKEDYRSPREEVQFILREELERRGFLTTRQEQSTQAKRVEHE